MSQMEEGYAQKEKDAEWLPHLTSEVVADARGPEFAAYAIALEGWRRGLTLKWHAKGSEFFKEMKTWSVDKPGKLFSLNSYNKAHYFFRSRGDQVTNEAVEQGADKYVSKNKLIEAGIPTPLGKSFDSDVKDKEIIGYAKEIGFPVVIKPNDGSYGRGVLPNIQDEQTLKEELAHLRNELNYKIVLVEQHIAGEEYRIYVVGDKVAGAIKRVPANVVGDGINTVRTLIGFKNKEKVKNPRLVSCLINVDQKMQDFIEQCGYSLDSVLQEGEQLFLNEISNVSRGGDPIGVTEELSAEVKETAVRALQAIPGLEHGAVDVMIDPNQPMTDAVVLELNPTAQIGGLLFPSEGEASDIPSAIIDYYFPETKNKAVTEKAMFYFDFMEVLHPLINRIATVTTVTSNPQADVYAKKYTVTGDVQQIGYHRGLRKQAFERCLNGFVRKLSGGDIEVVVAGTDPEMVADFENGIWEDPERSEVKEVFATEWEAPIKIGFEVKLGFKREEEELDRLKQEMELMELELKKAERENKNYQQSSSWKITKPLRAVGKLFK